MPGRWSGASMRAFAVSLFCLTVIAAAPVRAAITPPPVFPAVDGLGVDVATGAFTTAQTDVVIGQPGAGGLAYTRSYQSAPNAFWTHNHNGYIYANGAACSVVIGAFTETFTAGGGGCTSAFTSQTPRGATLTYNGATTYTYTGSDGTVAVFTKPSGGSQYGIYMILNMPAFTLPGVAYLNYTITPAGEATYYGYESSTPSCPYLPDWWACQYWTEITYVRLTSVYNNFGNSLWFSYSGPPEYPYQPNKVTGINLAIEYCVPGSCVNPWPAATYASSGSIMTVTNALNQTTTYTYSGERITEVQSPYHANHDINITYNGAGRVTSINPGPGTWSYAYADNAGNRTTTVTNPDNSTRTYVSVIASGRITAVTNELGQTVSYLYDSSNRETKVTLPEGNYVQYTYDSRGNITQTRRAAKLGSGLADIITYAAYPVTCTSQKTCNQPTSTTDARGYRTDYAYDGAHGGVLSITAPAPVGSGNQPQTRFAYAQFQARYRLASGWVNGAAVWRQTATSACATGVAPSCVGTADETLATVSYPGAGTPNNLLPTAATSRAGNSAVSATTTFAYTNWGDALTVDGPLTGTADTTRFYYDALRRTTGVVGPDPDGTGALLYRAARTTYNAAGRPTVVERGTVTNQTDTAFTTFALLEKQDTDYDELARPVQSRLWNGGTIIALTQTSYDTRGRPLCTATRMNPVDFNSPPTNVCAQGTPAGAYGADRIARTVYDNAGRISQQQSAYGTALVQTTAAYSYTTNGQVATLTDARGYRTTYAYDGFDRLSGRYYPHPDNTNASSTTDYEAFTYDAWGRLEAEERRDGEAFYFTYDNLGRMSVLWDVPEPQPETQPIIEYEYDLLNRVTSASQTGHTLTSAYDALSRVTGVTSSVLGTVGYQYNAAGRRTRLDYPGGFYVTYEYNAAGDLNYIKESGSTALATFGYDNLGRRASLTRGNGAVTSYSFDAISRLATLTQNPTGATHDVSFTFNYNPVSQITARTRSNAVYDWALAESFGEDYTNANQSPANGLNQYTSAPGPTGPITPQYDARGNLAGNGDWSYGYDFDNRLITADYDPPPPDSPSSVSLNYDPAGRLHQIGDTRFLYDGADLIAEYNTSGTVLKRYVHGPGLDEPLVWYEGSGTTDRRYLLADERGSVIGIANSGGTVTQVNAYDEYGAPAATNQGRFQYTGQIWLSELGLYHYKARLYDPLWGRFLQTDPIGTAGGMNLYGYVGNDPVNFSDPSGLCGFELRWQTIITGGEAVNYPSAYDIYWSRTEYWYTYDSFGCSVPVPYIGPPGVGDGGGGGGGNGGGSTTPGTPPAEEPLCNLVAPTGQFKTSRDVDARFELNTARKLSAALEQLNQIGIIPVITSGYRSPAQQDALRESNNPFVITPARVSWHQVGQAVDFGPNSNAGNIVWILLSMIYAGFEWGGTFNTPDVPHYQTQPAGTTPSAAMVSACTRAASGG